MDKKQTTWPHITSMCLGLASIFFWELSLIPILAIAFGAYALTINKEGKTGAAIIGIILGILYVIVAIVN